MKLLRLIIAALFLVSMVPMEAFCEDSHCITESGGQCAVACFHSAGAAEALQAPSFVAVTFVSDPVVSVQDAYENPVLSSLKKPPIALS